ncbi:carboxypeptidase-like regulatory domain-containing protein [Cellulophaga sp. HaHa_2_95]|uniref:TonB-dependent receptor n=1 Tax=unclassified Cellulophaga TaxID=2634405 RepID=UPI001C4E5EE2|nr:TonB-dependent receptor [Cellulophaga sp. HaHa_2_95]QXP57004.1 carboxypeptidase-like regulatory domain-containing protein [Cellulophaga sp. HaHa_2_95]
MKYLLVSLFLIVSTLSYAQDKGSVVGTVIDKEASDEPLAFANVLIKGTTKGTTTDFDGLYEIANVDPGTYSIVFSYLGYETIEIPNVAIEAGKVTTINVPMAASEGMSLDEVVVTTTTRKDSEAALLLDQKRAVEIKTAIGAQELAKKAVSDAADATTKVTGVNKKEGSSKIYVRGLGDRYNSTTFNGLPLPSNDPGDKNIDLSLFGTDIIENVGISKSFSANLSSDVAGANIDIVSREMTTSSLFKVGISSGYNSQTTFKDFKNIDGANWVGVNTDTKHNVRDLTVYSFSNGFTPETNTASPNLGLSINYGKKFQVSDESTISFFLVGSFDNKYSFQDGVSENVIDVGNTGSQFDTKTYNYNASKMLMGNLVYKINANHKLSFNHLFVHSNNQKIEDFTGTTTDIGRGEDDNRLVNLLLQTEVQNRLFVNQLLSNHKFGETIDVNASLGYSSIYNDEPDRRKNTFIIDNDDNTTRISQNAVRDNSRFYGNLFENDYSANVNAVKYLGERFENKGKVTLGYNGRITDRKFDGIYFDHNFSAPRTAFVDLDNLDNTFNQENLSNGVFGIETSRGRNNNDAETYLPQLYDADKKVHAAYIDAIYNLTDKFTANVGVRAEDIKMNVTWNTNISFPGFSNNSSIDLDKQYILPSLNLKYALNEKINLRASGSLSYTYPQFKEIAPFAYEGINYQESGNPGLLPSDNYNAEVKFEIFPKSNELFAVGVFGKLIQNSINRLERNSSIERDFTFDNAGDASVFGVEVETKLDLFNSESDDFKRNNISVGANATFMKTKLEYNTNNTSFNYTGSSSELEGASPFTINADVSYKFDFEEKETIASLVFNYQSDKVYSIGTNFQENIIEKAVPMLDLVFSHKFNKTIGLKLNAKNILNPSFERYRDIPEKITMNSYKNGVGISAGLSLNF